MPASGLTMEQKRIFLIDDDDDDQLIFKDALSEINSAIECIFANNGIEAISLLKKISPLPSLIFLDLNMPVMNGFECLQRLKQENRMKEIPVVIFTTSNNPLDRIKSKERGAEFYLTKCSDFELLKKQLKEIFNLFF